jgi:hypothetical protein
VRINGAAASLKTGDEILIYWVGRPGAGSSTSDQLVGVDNQNMRWTIGNTLIEDNRDSEVRVRYVVTRKAGGSEQSEIRTLQVRTAASAIYPQPTVIQAPAGVLNPMDALTGATLNVAYDDMLPSDIIAPIWDGKNDLVPWLPGNAGKSVDFIYPPSTIAASLGRRFNVVYGVLRGPDVIISDVLDLTVSPIPDSESAKSTPQVIEASNGVLDLNAFEGNANIFVAKWPLAFVDQKVWLTVTGPQGVPTIELLNAHPLIDADVANGIGRQIPREDLEKFADGDEMTVVFKAAFDGGADESTAFAFPDLRLRVVARAPDIVEDFTGQSELITSGQSLQTQHMTIRFVSGEGEAGFAGDYVLPPEAADYFHNPVLQVSYGDFGIQTLELELDTECRAVTCDVHGANTGGTVVRYLDAGKVLLESRTLAEEYNQHVNYASTGNRIRYIQIVSQKDWTLWDNFVMQV